MLKSLYISLYLTLAVACGAYAVVQLIGGGDVLAWTGVVLAHAPIVLMVAALMLRQNVARTSANLPVIGILAVAGAALGAAAYGRSGDALPMTLSVFGVVSFLVYNFWYSRFGDRASEELTQGRALPDLEFTNAGGATVSARDFAGQPTIWLFYRGNWCPLCMAQVREIAAHYRRLALSGVRVALVSPQSQRHTAALARRLDVPFEFLTDPDNRAARTLGIDAPGGLPAGMQVLGYESDTVMPTVIITDADNTIIWSHETDNYRVRPEPELFFEVLSEHRLTRPATGPA